MEFADIKIKVGGFVWRIINPLPDGLSEFRLFNTLVMLDTTNSFNPGCWPTALTPSRSFLLSSGSLFIAVGMLDLSVKGNFRRTIWVVWDQRKPSREIDYNKIITNPGLLLPAFVISLYLWVAFSEINGLKMIVIDTSCDGCVTPSILRTLPPIPREVTQHSSEVVNRERASVPGESRLSFLAVLNRGHRD